MDFVVIGRRLAEARTKAGLSQAALGQVIGVTGPRISHFESGHSFPRAEYRALLAKAVHMRPNVLFAEVEEKTNSIVPISVPIASSKSRDHTTQIVKLLQGMNEEKQNLALAMIRTINRIK